MLALPHTNSWGFVYTNQAVGNSNPGTSVTPGASNVEGSWTEIAPDASITTDIYYVHLVIHDGQSSANAKNHLLDFAWDPTGGTTYDQILFQNYVCGGSAAYATVGPAGRPIHFPCKIPAGSAIAVRIQGSNGTAGTVRVLGYFYGKPSRPELWRPAAYAETMGTITNSNGTSFTPGNGSFGSWASLGTTTKRHFWAQLGVQVDNAASAFGAVRLQLGIGDGTSGATHVITDSMFVITTGEQQSTHLQTPCTWEIPSGAEIWVRGAAAGAPDTGYNATAVLFGG